MDFVEIADVMKQLVVPIVTLSSLGFGYILKNYIPMDNKHIPAIMAVSGIVFTILIKGYVSFEDTIVAGALSGLASTGLHQAFSSFINKEDN